MSKARSKSHVQPQVDMRKPLQSLQGLAMNPRYATLVHAAILLGETCLCLLIVHSVTFTNIDWVAYMQQVETFLNGERNYFKIRGDTGPLVYPAGFLWVYSLLYKVTDLGKDIKSAQYMFVAVYIATMGIVLRLYRYDRTMPPYASVLLVLSKRLHSLYMLRLFNDCIAMLAIYAAIWAFATRRWYIGNTLFSLALSVKMSILLFAPAWGIILLASIGLSRTFLSGIYILAIQALLAMPFLLHDATAYFSRAFEFSRVFLYEWTVNWRFVPEKTFLSREFTTLLLLGHALVLLVAVIRWTKPMGGLYNFILRALRHPRQPAFAKPMGPNYIVNVFFLSNLVGMLFARSLHYQFYVWEAHQLVFLLWQTGLPVALKLSLLAGIEYGWETFPSTTASSLSLLVSHVWLVYSVVR